MGVGVYNIITSTINMFIIASSPFKKKHLQRKYVSLVGVSLILAHFVPEGAGPMKFTKASSNQPFSWPRLRQQGAVLYHQRSAVQ